MVLVISSAVKVSLHPQKDRVLNNCSWMSRWGESDVPRWIKCVNPGYPGETCDLFNLEYSTALSKLIWLIVNPFKCEVLNILFWNESADKKLFDRSPPHFRCCRQVLLLLFFQIMKMNNLFINKRFSEFVCSICGTSERVFSGTVGWHPPVCVKTTKQNKTSFCLWASLKHVMLYFSYSH